MNNFFSILIVGSLIAVFAPSPILAFGKNKVQYENLKWNQKATTYFDLYYHNDQGDLPKISSLWFYESFKNLSERFNYVPKQKVPLIVYGSTTKFEQTNIITEILPEEVGGFTELFKNRIAVPFSGSYRDLRHVLHHELVHAFTFSIISENSRGNLLSSTQIQVPFWFMEGSAEYLSSSWDNTADMFMIDRTINSYVPIPGPALNGYMAYKGGQSFLFFLESSRGRTLFKKFLLDFKNSKSVEGAIKRTYASNLETLGKEWVQELKRLYWPEIGIRTRPEKIASPVTSPLKQQGNFNLRPRISPNGTKVAFYSDRNDYTQIVITNLKGKQLQTISQNGYGGFFESFQPFRSGMCWSPSGDSLLFVTKAYGNQELRIVNPSKRKLIKKIVLKLSNIASPDWSNDGKKVVFTAVDNGASDIYMYFIENDSLAKITKSIAYEADPRFSPDNKSIIFSIEDTTITDTNSIAPWGKVTSDLMIMDLAHSTTVSLTKTRWNEKQAGFKNDSTIYYISDQNGIDNIYIAPLNAIEKASPISDFTGSCSNPDFGTSEDSLVFCLFQNQGWNIWLMENPTKKLNKSTLTATKWIENSLNQTSTFFTTVEPVKDTVIDTTKAKTPLLPVTVLSLKTDSTTITVDSSFQKRERQVTKSAKDTSQTDSSNVVFVKDTTHHLQIPKEYSLKFSPDMMGVGVGMTGFDNYAGQWYLSLSDILGNHRISLAGDVEARFDDFLHVYSSYFYLKRQLDIGFGAYYSKDISIANYSSNSFYRDTDIGGFAVASYPFSMFSRLDFQFYARHVNRDPVAYINYEFKTVGIQNSYSIILPSLSFAFDNILWGITGPLRGTRLLLSTTVSPPFSFTDDSFYSLDFDFRHYLHLFNRFVWANRVLLGAGMSLNSGSSARLYFLGGNENWFINSSINTDNYASNYNKQLFSDLVTPFRGWPYFGLTGSRVALFNSEFRFPFIKEVSIVWPFPFVLRYVNGAVFTDIGNAWSHSDQNGSLPLPDNIYGGVGYGFRANLGIFVLRFDRGWPINQNSPPINYWSLGAEF